MALGWQLSAGNFDARRFSKVCDDGGGFADCKQASSVALAGLISAFCFFEFWKGGLFRLASWMLARFKSGLGSKKDRRRGSMFRYVVAALDQVDVGLES